MDVDTIVKPSRKSTEEKNIAEVLDMTVNKAVNSSSTFKLNANSRPSRCGLGNM